MKNKFYYNLFFWGGAVIALLALNVKIITLNHIVNNGRTVLVPLYFAEENDFKENGYMKIRYENIIPDTNFDKNEGAIVVSSDINKVVIYSRFLTDDRPVEVGEFVIRYNVKRPSGFFESEGIVRIAFGSERFYFREKGLSQHYMRARYAVLKLSEDGSSVLYGLADMNYQDLGRFF